MTTMSIVNVSQANCGFEFHCEFKEVPVGFVNALRRILLADIPTVVLHDIEILENTTQFPHEILKDRVRLLPVNVVPSDSSVIRDAKVELRLLPDPKERLLTTADFVVSGGQPTLLMGDRDTGAPLLFCKVRPNERLHIKAGLALGDASQVCVSTLSYHVDPERAKEDREAFLEDGGEPAVFDNFYIQKSYSRDERGLPNWIDLNVESIGVLPAIELVRMASTLLKQKIDTYVDIASSAIARHKDNEYSITVDSGSPTELVLLQQVLYSDLNVNFVSYDIPHPLKPTTCLRIHTKATPESVIATARTKIHSLCELVKNGPTIE